MPSLLNIQKQHNALKTLKNSVADLSNYTQRNTICYYSNWLFSPDDLCGINDQDTIGFMEMCNGLNYKKGVDLILHTPGGDVGATESIINHLNEVFNGDIRSIVPQIAMSGGTMIACSTKEIIMGKQSSLCPVNPIFKGLPAHSIISEIEKIIDDIDENPSRIAIWNPILSNLNLTLLDTCYKSIEWANEILENSLKNNMFKDSKSNEKVKNIIDILASPKITKSHDRHLNVSRCKEIGLNITMMEDNPVEEDLILSIHRACMNLLSEINAYKIFVNQKGKFLDFNS